MRKKGYYNTIQHKFVILFLSFCFGLIFAETVTADIFYLDDGSVLTGDILEETTEHFLIDNSRLGQLYVLHEDIIHTETPQIDTLSESYTIVDQTFEIIARLSRSVPERRPDVNSFNMLIYGSVLSVIDANGSDISFDQQPIGDSDLITIDYEQLSPETNRLTIITQQEGLVQNESGLYTFRLKYILNEDGRIRVIVKYPKIFQLETINPESKIESNGLIVWDQEIKRQQHFMPEVQFIP